MAPLSDIYFRHTPLRRHDFAAGLRHITAFATLTPLLPCRFSGFAYATPLMFQPLPAAITPFSHCQHAREMTDGFTLPIVVALRAGYVTAG